MRRDKDTEKEIVVLPEEQKIIMILFALKQKMLEKRMYEEAITLEIVMDRIEKMAEEIRLLRLQTLQQQQVWSIAPRATLSTVHH